MIKEVIYSEFIEEEPIIRDWIDEHGREVLDSRPVAISIPQLKAPSSMMELVHQLYAQLAAEKEVESFEDADDFDVPDELGIEMRSTPYEQDFDHLAETATAPSEPASVPVEPSAE